jgi:hypothetical protein
MCQFTCIRLNRFSSSPCTATCYSIKPPVHMKTNAQFDIMCFQPAALSCCPAQTWRRLSGFANPSPKQSASFSSNSHFTSTRMRHCKSQHANSVFGLPDMSKAQDSLRRNSSGMQTLRNTRGDMSRLPNRQARRHRVQRPNSADESEGS